MESNEIPDEALDKIHDPEFIRRQVVEGKSFQEILGYTEAAMEQFYTAGRNLFLRQEYKKAADAFIFLTTLNPYVHSYWLGLGMSEQLEGMYQGALLAYMMAILTDMENPIAHYHSATCYIALGDEKSAVASLESAIACAEKPEYSSLKLQAQGALERIKK